MLALSRSLRYTGTMSNPLTPEQAREIDHRGDRPLEVVHPRTHKVYYVIAGDQFNRAKPLFDDGKLDVRDLYEAQESAFEKIWNDPALDVYNDRSLPPSA